ncbi:MAG: YdcF family protein [Magnetospirillum sp.]|nr:YdcF family protein [Magnetospirillum sp.]
MKHRHLKSRRLDRLGAAVVAMAALWCGGFLWFVDEVPRNIDDQTSHTDAIVVLTGGRDRLTTGLDLLEAGLSQRLFISGVYKGVDLAEILYLGRGHPGLKDAVVLGYAADDTVGNAVETAQWASEQNLRSLRLVTGAYHMPRALAEFRHALPGIRLVAHPVFPDHVKSREWWRWPGTAALLATEYSKYLAAITRHWFLPRKAAP